MTNLRAVGPIVFHLLEMEKGKDRALIEPEDEGVWRERGWRRKGTKVHVSDPTPPPGYVPPRNPRDKPLIPVEEKPDWKANRVGPGAPGV